MRAAEIRFFWYRAELCSLFSRLPRARCSRGAPFLFFPPPLDVRKRRAGLPRRRGSSTPPMNSNPFQKNTCSENVEFSLSFSRSQKVSTGRKEPPERVFFRERRAQSRHGRREKVIEWGAGWGGRVSNLRERVMSRAPIPSFFFSFFLWEKRFDESLNFSDLFFLLIYSFSLSLSRHQITLPLHKILLRLDAKKKKKRRKDGAFLFLFRAREMEQNRTDAIAGRDSSRVSVDAEGCALPSSSKFGFFLFFVRWCGVLGAMCSTKTRVHLRARCGRKERREG